MIFSHFFHIFSTKSENAPSSPLFNKNKADKSASNTLNPSIFEGLVTLCAPDAVCFGRHIPHASGRILAERFYVIGTLRSNFLLHKKSHPHPSDFSDRQTRMELHYFIFVYYLLASFAAFSAFSSAQSFSATGAHSSA